MRIKDAAAHGRAYRWAQRVAGLRYPPRAAGAEAVQANGEAAVSQEDAVTKKVVGEHRECPRASETARASESESESEKDRDRDRDRDRDQERK